MPNHALALVIAMAACWTSLKAETVSQPLPEYQTVLDRVHSRISAHDDAGALATLQDFFERGRSVPALIGVRDSYILAAWAEVASAYAPARTALLSVRDADVGMIVAGDDIDDDHGDQAGQPANSLFIEVSSIDECLGDSAHAIALFKRLVDHKPKLAGICFMGIERQLLAAGERSLCLTYIGDSKRQVDLEVGLYHDMAGRIPSMANDLKDRSRAQVDYVIAVLAANDRIDDCRAIAAREDLCHLFPGWPEHVMRLVERHRGY